MPGEQSRSQGRIAGGRVRWSVGAHLTVTEQTAPAYAEGPVVLLAELVVVAGDRGGLLEVEVREVATAGRTVLVVRQDNLFTHRPGSTVDRVQQHRLRLRAGEEVRVLVLEHPLGADEGDVFGCAAGYLGWGRGAGPEEVESAAEPGTDFEVPADHPADHPVEGGVSGGGGLGFPAPRTRAVPPPRMEPPPDLAPPPAAPPPAAPPPAAPRAAEPAGGDRETTLVLAEVGAGMPATVRLHEKVTVEVRLSRSEVRFVAGETHDEQIVVLDPSRPVSVTLLRRGFDLLNGQSGTRELRLPDPGEPEAVEQFLLVAATLGPQEVQVVVRQDLPQPLATLRLTPVVVAADAPLPAIDVLDARRTVAPGVVQFLAPRTLTIDENLVGTTSELTFELVVPGLRRQFVRRVPDKQAVLAGVFAAVEGAWQQHRAVPGAVERAAAFQESLREVGRDLAAQVVPGELLDLLREHPDEVEDLTVITSGETDVPWELVHVWDDDPGDPHDDLLGGFLGRAGLVRWVYNTAHPRDLTVRADKAYVMVARRPDRSFVLPATQGEWEYLTSRGARELEPLDAQSVATLITSGELDLLHFCGHGLSDDSGELPVRAMLLGDSDGPRFGLAELADSLPDVPPLRFGDPGPLVVLNACRIGQPPSSRSEVGGFAEAFLRGGAGAFVGCLWSVGDEPAAEFVQAFYDRLASGDTIAAATVAARRAARAAGDTSWLAYTVYAHPDARLDAPGLHPRGTAMSEDTSTTDLPRGTQDLSPEDLRRMHPYVVDLTDGRLSTKPAAPPTSIEDFHTTAADVDALFSTHLPAFLAEHPGQTVPLVIYAHGGLVPKKRGLGIAHKQIEWWLANGAFPVHFVWDTALVDSLVEAIRSALTGRRGLDDITDKLIEKAAQGLQARRAWGEMKKKAGYANQPVTGGAHHFATRLAEYVAAHPGAITVHAVGHSAGSIFHSHLLPTLLEKGVPVASLSLLAPAIRVDEFKQRLLDPGLLKQIGALTMFTMDREQELDDNCGRLYRKSLLYLIRNGLEPEVGAEILGLQECVGRDPALSALFGAPGSGSPAEVIWSVDRSGPPSGSRSTSHGGFDDDVDTMNSVAQRILGAAPQRPFPASPKGRGPDDDLWDGLDVPPPATGDEAAAGRRRALCIGIDAYPDGYALAGCVNDSQDWAKALGSRGFEVTMLNDAAATRDGIIAAVRELLTSSTAGDQVVVQYAGHGTTAPDLDGDEAEEDEGRGELLDEAICPVDFVDGNLLIDDDLGRLWDELPDGVGLTVFFDSCHSGGAQRAPLPVPGAQGDRRPRMVELPRSAEDAYRAKRAAEPRADASRDRERGVFFGACQPDEVAWESQGHGDFTAKVLPLLAAAGADTTNRDLYDDVVAAFGRSRKQTPVLRPPYLESGTLLGGSRAVEIPGVVVPIPGVPTSTEGGATARDRAIATILRGIADLLES